jgi:hypothetical protein
VTAQQLLDKALTECSWEDIKRCIGAPDSASHASHRLLHVHVKPGPNHDVSYMAAASRYVTEKLAMLGGEAHIGRLQSLVHLSMSEPGYRAAAGAFFESYAHRRLQNGGHFEVSFQS